MLLIDIEQSIIVTTYKNLILKIMGLICSDERIRLLGHIFLLLLLLAAYKPRAPPVDLIFQISNQIGGFFMNMLEEYSEYTLEKRYFIVWYIDLYNRYEQEVDLETFVQAIEDMDSEKNLIPYSIKFKYFVKNKHFDFIEVSKEVYAELYKWQNSNRRHELYQLSKYRNLDPEIDIESFEGKESVEDTALNNIETAHIKRRLKRLLTPNQYKVIHKIIFEDKPQNVISRENHISRQAVNNTLYWAKKKLKKSF